MDGSMMGTKRTSEDILKILAQVITSEKKSVHALVEDTKELGETVWSEAIVNHVELIQLVQELFPEKVVMEELDTGKKTSRVIYKEANKRG
jgi:hypothetical protein